MTKELNTRTSALVLKQKPSKTLCTQFGISTVWYTICLFKCQCCHTKLLQYAVRIEVYVCRQQDGYIKVDETKCRLRRIYQLFTGSTFSRVLKTQSVFVRYCLRLIYWWNRFLSKDSGSYLLYAFGNILVRRRFVQSSLCIMCCTAQSKLHHVEN